MIITDVRVRKVAKEGKMKAVVSITIDDEFVVHDIKVIEGEKGLFIAMPSRKASDGEYKDIAHPINSATREKIQKIILENMRRLPKKKQQLRNKKKEPRQKVAGFFFLCLGTFCVICYDNLYEITEKR